jgi:hypothetical protein
MLLEPSAGLAWDACELASRLVVRAADAREVDATGLDIEPRKRSGSPNP